jgi:YbbR domain-containing protein
MKRWLFNNFWIKVISLILAIITWIYVNGELSKQNRLASKFYGSELYKSYLEENLRAHQQGNNK